MPSAPPPLGPHQGPGKKGAVSKCIYSVTAGQPPLQDDLLVSELSSLQALPTEALSGAIGETALSLLAGPGH